MNTDTNKWINDGGSGQGLKHAPLTDKIIGAFYDVYDELGYGFLEAVYQRSMLLALTDAGLGVEAKVRVQSSRVLERSDEAQLPHYLRATEVEVGLLLKFGIRPQFRRLLFDSERKKIREIPSESVAEAFT